MQRRVQRQARTTVLIVCEGKRDKAFLEYMRSIYCAGTSLSPNIDVRQARGKGGDNVVSTLLGMLNTKTYNHVVAFMDSDLCPSPKNMRLLMQRRKMTQALSVLARPCLEGLFLDIFGEVAPPQSEACKRLIESRTRSELYDAREYHRFLTREDIDAYVDRCNDEHDFKKLMKLYQMGLQ